MSEQISPLDQPKVKYLAEQISPNGTKYDRQIMEKHKAACPLFVLALLPPYNDLSFGEGSSAEDHLWRCFRGKFRSGL
jgi:hypothetical protein